MDITVGSGSRRQPAGGSGGKCPMASDGASPAYARQLRPTVDRVLEAPGRRLHVQQSCGGCHGARVFKAAGWRPNLLLTSSGGNHTTRQGKWQAWLPMQTLLSSPASSIAPQAMLAHSSPLHPSNCKARSRAEVRPSLQKPTDRSWPACLVPAGCCGAATSRSDFDERSRRPDQPSSARLPPPRLDCRRCRH